MNTRMLIDGEFIDSSDKEEIINPSTGSVITQVALAGKEKIDSAITSARKAFDKGSWTGISLKERKSYLLKISQGILGAAAELAKLETLNTGKPIKESTFMDIPSAAKSFEYIANNLERYLSQEKIDSLVDARATLNREPQGVVVLIVPWNYPLLIASWKLAYCLAAGNSVVLKPSSLTPLTVLALGKIISEAGLPKGVVNIINASGTELGHLLSGDDRVDMISFTGSNEVGREILKSSAGRARKMIMELGGKSASIILKDADLESAVNGSLCSIFLNQGQMCTAMSRIFIEEAIFDEFVERFVRKAKSIKLGDGLDYETQMGPLISQAQRERVIDYVDGALKQGAKALCGGKIPADPNLQNGFFFEPTVLTSVTPQMKIFKEEVFGPVACVDKFRTLQQAVDLANSSDFGLAASIWTKDTALAENLASKINSGTIWINTYGMFYNELPYGGFKQSGFGKELGKDGFLEYTRLKNVVIDTAKDSKPIVNYWYGL